MDLVAWWARRPESLSSHRILKVDYFTQVLNITTKHADQKDRTDPHDNDAREERKSCRQGKGWFEITPRCW